jgi:ribosomal subunit interface protein
MKISVTGRHMNVGESLREHASNKLQETGDKYFRQAVEGHIVFDRHNHGFQADIQVHVGRNIMVQGHGEADDAYVAFDMALSRINGRLRRYKTKIKDTKNAPSHQEMADIIQASNYVLAGAGHESAQDEAPEQPLVIAEMTTKIETLSVAEAVMRMDLSGYPVVVFRNSKGNNLNVVYRRADGNIGWIDPGDSAGKSAKGAAA